MKAAHHVVEHAQARLAHAAIARQPALGKYGLRHAGLGRHHDVALEHPPVKLVAGIAPHEIGAGRAHQRRERPDARPLAHRVGERRLVGGHEARQHVVHVRAVIHHQHYRGVGIDAGNAGGVDVAESHAVQRAGDGAPEPVADAKVEIGVERRHDLARIALDFFQHRGQRRAVARGVLLGGLLHLRIGEQAMHQRLAPRALERADADAQAMRDVVDHLVRRTRHHPAQRRNQQVLIEGPRGEHCHRDREPQRHADQAASN